MTWVARRPGPGELPLFIPGTRTVDRHSIRKARTLRGMTMEMLGERLGVSHTTVSRWEAGDTVPSGLYLRVLVQFLMETNRIIRKLVDEIRPQILEDAHDIQRTTDPAGAGSSAPGG